MKHIAPLINVIQEYAWGSITAIPELLGTTPNPQRPQAELWMGAHPKAPSRVRLGDRDSSLADVIAAQPVDLLGKAAAGKFANQMPFLFKVLAAAQPLSIQAHPGKKQAVAGFEKENEMGIPLDAPHRNYRDDNHKPECICAMTPFWALRGFRPVSETLALMENLRGASTTFERIIASIERNPNGEGLKHFFQSLLTLKPDQRNAIIRHVVNTASKKGKRDAAFEWIGKLHDAYPEDIGILSPLFLNLVCLKLQEAMFLPAGELHAYLEGVGIELMANSDNVLRGGLTPKHIDVPELLNNLNFQPAPVDILLPEAVDKHESVYPSFADEFVLSVITIKPGEQYTGKKERGLEILLCTQGQGEILEQYKNASQTCIPFKKGMSFVVPAAVNSYGINGEATLFKAAVPI